MWLCDDDDDDDIFLRQLMFIYEAMFHMNGHANRNNYYICQLPYEMYGHVQDSLEVNVQCGIVHGAVMSNIYLGMLHLFLFPQIAAIEQEEGGEILFQRDGVAPHFRPQVQCS